jgi:hypothetical protein
MKNFMVAPMVVEALAAFHAVVLCNEDGFWVYLGLRFKKV